MQQAIKTAAKKKICQNNKLLLLKILNSIKIHRVSEKLMALSLIRFAPF
jgi:hypothetical protein